jgi:hypothetical protein
MRARTPARRGPLRARRGCASGRPC